MAEGGVEGEEKTERKCRYETERRNRGRDPLKRLISRYIGGKAKLRWGKTEGGDGRKDYIPPPG